MEFIGEQPRETKTRWIYKIQRAEKVGILFNGHWGDYDICRMSKTKTLKRLKQKHPCILPHQFQIIIILRYQSVWFTLLNRVLWEGWNNLKINMEGITLGEICICQFFGYSLQHHFPWMLSRGVKNNSDVSVPGHELFSNFSLICM